MLTVAHPINLPTFNGVNYGRNRGWTIASCAVRLADAGPNGLAGWILRDGFRPDPQCLLTVAPNTDGDTFATLCAEILTGLDSRRTDEGAVRTVCFRAGLDGKGRGPSVQVSAIAAVLNAMAQDVADYVIPAHGDGRERTIATILAHAYDVAGGGEGIPVVHVHVQPTGAASGALTANILREMATRLDPWAKIQGSVALLRERPTMQESELMRIVGFKRGDGQLAYRGAAAILRHRLQPDESKRCPSKEEWKEVLDCVTSEQAVARLEELQNTAREKKLGIDSLIKGLEKLPETATLAPRDLQRACESPAALDAYIAKVMGSC